MWFVHSCKGDTRKGREEHEEHESEGGCGVHNLAFFQEVLGSVIR